MNKSELVGALADSAGMTKADASRALDSLFGSGGVIARALRAEKRVQITDKLLDAPVSGPYHCGDGCLPEPTWSDAGPTTMREGPTRTRSDGNRGRLAEAAKSRGITPFEE